jgi:glycosyltransferase involved in cell wall biosynthesis
VVKSASAAPLVTVIIPTHDHPSTLDLAVASVLGQTTGALDVVIIGDGVSDDTRDVVAGLLVDDRVRFLDTPKSASRAEPVRHKVLTEALAPYVCYMGDDDLMLADHVESTVSRLQTSDFTHPLPVNLDRSGSLRAHPTDIAEPECVAWHMHPQRNAISLTGAGHRLDAYHRLPRMWQAPPAGAWSDHYMWQQWFSVPSLRFSTGDRLTVLKFGAEARTDMNDEERRVELLEWIDRSRQPGFEAWLAAAVAAAYRRYAVRSRLDLDALTDEVSDKWRAWEEERSALLTAKEGLEAEMGVMRSALAAAEARAGNAEAEARQTRELLDASRATRTWRVHDRFARYAIARWIARW